MTIRRAARRTVAVLAVAAAAATSSPAAVDPTPGELQAECPAIMPLADVTPGLRGTALSVVRGRAPVAFGADVLGTLHDAVGPGRHLVVVNLTGSAVTAAGGLWAGASGSPVFFRDPATGRHELAGAIAYGLAGGGSTLAGLTPAEDMASLLGSGGGTLAGVASVRVTRTLAARMAEVTGFSVAQLGSLSRLKLPLSASGLGERGLERLREAIDREGLPFLAYAGSSPVGENPPSPTGTLRAGESLAAALSVGDVTVAGVGTTTFVCGGRVVAFGHPMSWTGRTTLGARAADTLTIVPDPVWGSYKLANVAESVGTVTQDRLAGIVGELGVGPATRPVTSSVTDLDTGRTRTGQSAAITPEFLPFLAFEHLFLNVDVTIDRIGPGNAEIAYEIRGTREDGAPWEYRRTNHYASEWDISFESVWEVSLDAELLAAFPGEDVEVTAIDVSRLDIEEAFEQYRVRNVLVRAGGKWRKVEFVRARPGKLIRVRTVLAPRHASGTRNVDLAVRVPETMRRPGILEVSGGGGGLFGELCLFGCEEAAIPAAKSSGFDGLLARLAGRPRADTLVVRLRAGGGKVRAQAARRLDAVVVGGRQLGVLVVR